VPRYGHGVRKRECPQTFNIREKVDCLVICGNRLLKYSIWKGLLVLNESRIMDPPMGGKVFVFSSPVLIISVEVLHHIFSCGTFVQTVLKALLDIGVNRKLLFIWHSTSVFLTNSRPQNFINSFTV